jgi:transcriptional regulator with XRE-family HTH domain
VATSIHSIRYREFCRRLRQAREASGLSQEEVGRRVRRDQTFVSKVESGERRLDLIEADDLAAIYGKPLSWFVPPRGR